MEEGSFKEDFIANKSNEGKLKKIIENADIEQICATIVAEAGEDFGFSVWTAVLSHVFDEDRLFEIIKEVLPKLNRDQLPTKILTDFYSRLNIELPRLSLNFIINLAYFCGNNIQFGDVRAVFFKDIIPCILQILVNGDRSVTIDGVTKQATEYHQEIITGILCKPFKVSVLTGITGMFKDIPLNKQQTELLLGKICDNFSNVPHSSISGLALACFNLSLFNRLIIPVLALDTYFFEKRYKQKFAEMESDIDVNSIDEIAEKGMIETEENVVYHFQQVTEFTSIEKDIVNALKPLAFAPKFIISPFIATILVSFAKMSSSSVAGNLRLPQSILLPFIKQVFKNNEKHRMILRQSAWARCVDKFESVDIEKLLKILQENTCKRGQNVALNGFIGLAFMLLKTKGAPSLNSFAVQFLNELVRTRQEFSGDIMRIVVKMLFSEPNKGPIIDCFSVMIQNRALPLDRCEEALTELIENLTELELDTAMAIESVINSAITKSSKLRELMVKTMRSAMYQNKPGLRKLAVFSFCIMLRKVSKQKQSSTSHEYLAGPSLNISMMSLMSQSQLPSIDNVCMRRCSVMVLEILGILRKCFSHNAEIRVTLYESLLGAVIVNPFIIPNVLELVETQFRDYFDNENNDVIINFSKAFKLLENGEQIVIMDHLGKFLGFFIGCIAICYDKTPDENSDQMKKYQDIIEKLIDKVGEVTMEQLDVFAALNIRAASTITQFVNCLEALMFYCTGDITTNINISRIKKLFDKHQKITTEALKLQENGKKLNKKGKTPNQAVEAKIELNFECVWQLKECGNFMNLVFEDHKIESVNEIKQSASFFRFVVKSTSQKIAKLTTSPNYLKLKHSKSTFSSLKTYAAILFRQMEIETFSKIYEQFDNESAVAITDAFKNTINTMDLIFNTPVKWQEFLKMVTEKQSTIDEMIMQLIKQAQTLADWAFDAEKNDIHADPQGEKIVINLLMTIEILFKNFQVMPNIYSRDAYNWMWKFCKKNEITQKNLQVVNRVFFQFMAQQDSCNIIMEHVANKISIVYGRLDINIIDEPADFPQNDLKSISLTTIDQTSTVFANLVRKQIDDVEFCILRMNSFNAYIKTPGQDSQSSVAALQSLETSSVVKLEHLGKVVGTLCNTRYSLRGSQIETVGKVGITYFACLFNLMKHFCQHYDVKNIDYQRILLEKLMKATKVIVKLIYALQPYVVEMVEEEQRKAKRDNKKKMPANKELKYMSRLVLTVEKFKTIVHKFDVITKKKFHMLLHTGDVRDFRILRKPVPAEDSSDDAMEGTSATEVNESDEEAESSDKEAPQVAKKPRRSRLYSSSEDEQVAASDSDETNASYESLLPIAPDGFEKNLKQIVNKSRSATENKKQNVRKT